MATQAPPREHEAVDARRDGAGFAAAAAPQGPHSRPRDRDGVYRTFPALMILIALGLLVMVFVWATGSSSEQPSTAGARPRPTASPATAPAAS